MAAYKNQHTVSKSYLRRFTLNDSPNTLWEHRKSTRKVSERNVDKATVNFHCYSIRLPNGDWDHSFEHELGSIESAALQHFSEIEAGDFDSPAAKSTSAWKQVTAFIAASFGRTSGMLGLRLSSTQELAAEARKRAVEIARSSHTTPVAENVSGALPDDHDENAIKRRVVADWMKRIESEANDLTKLHWRRIIAPANVDFIASDQPVFARPKTDDETTFGTYITPMDPNAVVHFPISRHQFLLGSHNQQTGVSVASEAEAAALNARVIRSAFDRVFAGSQTASTTELLQAFADNQPPLPDLSALRESVLKTHFPMPAS